MKNAFGLRASIAATALVGGSLFAGSVFAQACTTDNWSSVENAASLSASGPADSQARYVGRCSLAVDATGTATYVQDDSPEAETSYRSRFYVLARHFGDASDVEIFETDSFDVSISRNGSDVSFSAGGVSADGVVGWNSVEVHWDDSGSLALLVNSGDVADAVAGSAGTTPLTFARLGNINGAGSGTLIFDDFESRRTETIGTLLACDALGDGEVGVADARAILREAILGEIAAGVPDCLGDGEVSVADARRALRIAVGLD